MVVGAGMALGTADWARCMAKKADGAGGGGRYEVLKDMALVGRD